MKKFCSADTGIIPYVLNKIKVSIRHGLTFHGLRLTVMLIVLLGASSCRTCNCPAYSYKPETATEKQSTSEQNPEIVNNSFFQETRQPEFSSAIQPGFYSIDTLCSLYPHFKLSDENSERHKNCIII